MVTGAVVSALGTVTVTARGAGDSQVDPLRAAYTAYVFVLPATGAVSVHEPVEPVTVQTDATAVGAVRATR